jgi:cyclic beta-1,2-glucan synthetase
MLLLYLPLSIAVENELGIFPLTLIALFAAFSASDIATGMLNRFVIDFVPPRHLPRLELKDGIVPLFCA